MTEAEEVGYAEHPTSDSVSTSLRALLDSQDWPHHWHVDRWEGRPYARAAWDRWAAFGWKGTS